MAVVRFTTRAVINESTIDRFPLILLDDGGVHWLSLSYFLDLRRQGAAVSSIRTYGAHLSDFISQMEVDGLELEKIEDAWLEAYRNSILRREGEQKNNSENYASQLLRSVISFMYWLETNEYLRGVVGERKDSAVRIVKTRNGVSHWLAKNKGGKNTSISAPKVEWINKIKPYGPKRTDLSERFELMIDWEITLGLRAMEICHFTIAQLPDLESAETALAQEELLFIPVLINKGGGKKNIPISPLLVKKTWQYIYTTRKTIVHECSEREKKKYEIYSDPGYVFLSSRTGQKLSPRGYSNSIRKAFLAAVDAGLLTKEQRVWCHGFRHYLTTTLQRKLDEMGVKRPEAIVRQVTRHASDDALQPYLVDRHREVFASEYKNDKT